MAMTTQAFYLALVSLTNKRVTLTNVAGEHLTGVILAVSSKGNIRMKLDSGKTRSIGIRDLRAVTQEVPMR